MPRRSREDEPGAILHLFNRGLAKRTVFENRDDVRYFLSRLAREHRRGRLLTHAFNLLGNHFHLLAESPQGRASEAMRVIQNEYVRRFNRLRRRDGPLFRGRFGSRRVRSERYWWVLMRYIDMNAVDARLATSEVIYPFGSARYYLTEIGPRWLTRNRIERLLCESSGSSTYGPGLYERLLSRPLSVAEKELVESRMRGERTEDDPLDELLNCGSPRLRAWLRAKAENADGTRPGIAVLSPSTLLAVVRDQREMGGEWIVENGTRPRDGWDLILTGLLRELCCLTLAEICARCKTSDSAARRSLKTHRKLLLADEEYARRAAQVLELCLAAYRIG